MTSLGKKILVLGATGLQGGAATAQLLADGWQVRALTRNASSEAAKALERKSVELAQGDMGDRAALDAAMQGVYGVFSVQPPEWDLTFTAEEIRLGKNVADAAKAAGVRHFVYSSLGGAEQQSNFREVAKWEVEKHIRSLGLQATVLRPSAYMENYVNFDHYGIRNGTYADATRPDVPVNLIAVDDIGAFVGLAFKHPEQYIGKTLELAGDALTPPDIVAAISRETGQAVTFRQIPAETIREQNEILGRIYDWINAGGYQVDRSSLRELHPGLMTFDVWLEKIGKARFAALFGERETAKNTD